MERNLCPYDDVIKWKHFPRYWPFVSGIHWSPLNSPHKGQWRGALMFSFICARINDWVNNRKAGDLKRHRAHYEVFVMPRWWPFNIKILFVYWLWLIKFNRWLLWVLDSESQTMSCRAVVWGHVLCLRSCPHISNVGGFVDIRRRSHDLFSFLSWDDMKQRWF